MLVTKKTKPIIEYAHTLGFSVSCAKRNQHLRFKKQGCQTIYSSATPSDHRAMKNAMCQLRRSSNGARTH